MPSINRVRVTWTQFPGAPGLSTFYLNEATTDVTALKTFFTAIKDLVPSGLTFTIPQAGDVIDVGTGQISGVWTGTGGGQVVSAASSALTYSGSSGAMVRWISGAIVEGHRLTGRTYIVPLVSSAYDVQGSLATTAQTTLQTAANAMVTSYAQNLLVYHKHRDADDQADPPDLGSPGVTSGISVAIVPDLAVVLRSRRT